MDHDAFDKKPQDGLAGVEIGVEETGPQPLEHPFCSRGMGANRVGSELLGACLGEGHLRRQTALLQRLHAGSEGVQRKHAELIGVQQSVLLAAQLLPAVFRVLEALGEVGRALGGLFGPGAEMGGHCFGVGEQVPNRGPDGLVDARCPEPLIAAAVPHRIRQGSHAHAAVSYHKNSPEGKVIFSRNSPPA